MILRYKRSFNPGRKTRLNVNQKKKKNEEISIYWIFAVPVDHRMKMKFKKQVK